MTTTTYWNDRCEQVRAIRREPEAVDFVPIPAPHLAVGDCLIWGDRWLNVTDLREGAGRGVDQWIVAVCEYGSDHLTINLSPREEVLVLTPRPYHVKEVPT